VPIRIIRIINGGTIAQAEDALEVPRNNGQSAWFRTGLWDSAHEGQITKGILALIQELDQIEEPVDYARRRSAIRAWTLAPDQWSATILKINTELPKRNRVDADLRGRAHLAATAYVWARVTQGDYRFAPCRPASVQLPPAQRPGSSVHWPLLHQNRPTPTQRLLRQNLDQYADAFAHRIDNLQPGPPTRAPN
jgi:hypothetical protein